MDPRKTSAMCRRYQPLLAKIGRGRRRDGTRRENQNEEKRELGAMGRRGTSQSKNAQESRWGKSFSEARGRNYR